MSFEKILALQTACFPLIEQWRESRDQRGAYGALLTDLLEAFKCLPHELIIGQLDAYGVDMPLLKLINSC